MTERQRHRLSVLADAQAWKRVAARLPDEERFDPPVLLHADGELRRGGAVVAIEDVGVDAAWASPDLFIGGRINHFLDLASAAPALQWLQSGAAGVDNPRFARLAAAGVRLTASDAPAVSIAELVLAGVLDHYQRGPERRAAQAEAVWRQLPFREIAGSRWLVIGFGSIGRAVGERARAFGAHVTGVRRSGGEEPGADRIEGTEAVPRLLPDADIVVLALPLVAATRDYADAAFFARMKRGSIFVNVGRGLLVDEEALLAALDEGRVGHAVLDVFRTEPLPPESPLWRHPRVALTAHLAGMGSGLTERSDALFLDNLARFAEGRPLRNMVDPGIFAGGH